MGLWGLWISHFSAQQQPFLVGIQFGDESWFFGSSGGLPSRTRGFDYPDVFEWVSPSGMAVRVFSPGAVLADVANCWVAMLHYEAQAVDRCQTFFPVSFPLTEFTRALSSTLVLPPQVLLINGQPGTGKKAALGFLLLSHCGRRLQANHLSQVAMLSTQSSLMVIPEIAMLEPAEQLGIVDSVGQGGYCWAATAYDLAMLRSRKIIIPQLADILEPARLLMPAISRSEPADIQILSSFWLHLHGSRSQLAAANLSFQKQKALGVSGLSVEAILEEGRGLRGVIAEFERDAIIKAHARVGRSQHKIARLLKVSRGSLQHKLRKYQLESFATPDADNEES